MHEPKSGRIDLHLHSRASNVTDYYTSNTLSIPESYSDPVATWQLLKRRGMDLVTLTDHNSIDGVLELLAAGLPDVFISAEMTASFPEDGCNIHVTVANITEAQFREIDRLRRNVYEMIAYVDGEIAAEAHRPEGNRIAYFMTHPLMSTQNRPYGREGSLRVEHIEKALLLCNCLEVRNGTRGPSVNRFTERLIASLTPGVMERLAEKHGLPPKGMRPWQKAIVGGSDDHSGINPGLTWTSFSHRGDRPVANDVIDAIRRRDTAVGGEHGGPVILAHAVVKLLYDGQFQRDKERPAKPVCVGGPLNLLLTHAFGTRSPSLRQRLALQVRSAFRVLVLDRLAGLLAPEPTFERVLMGQAHALLREKDFRARLAACERTDDRIFTIISTLLNRIFAFYVDRLRDKDSLDIFRTVKQGVALLASHVFVSLPYFICYSHQSADKSLLRDARQAFGLHDAPRLLLVTDTLFDVNGVARTIRRMMDAACTRGVDLTVATCLSAAERARHEADPEVAALVAAGRLRIFTSIVSMDMPEYSGLQVRFLPFLEFLKFAQDQGFTRMQISTPGPVGLAGLLAARILQIETSSTYHTSFPEYVEHFTGDISLEALTWKYMLWFYQAVDEVVVPSRYIARLLHERGLRNRKLLVLDRWVDARRFHPGLRTKDYWRRHGLVGGDELVKFVHVGRVSVEKNLDLLAEAYAQVRATEPRAHLVIIGDGPHRGALEARLAGLPVTFTGFLEGAELARALASADVKLFPSTTDTWGNAPLEAQACGLPVVVSDKGGPQELMEHGVTGLRVPGGDLGALAQAMRALMDDETRAAMGRAARTFVEVNDVPEPYTAIFDPETHRARQRAVRVARREASAGARPGHEGVAPGASVLAEAPDGSAVGRLVAPLL